MSKAETYAAQVVTSVHDSRLQGDINLIVRRHSTLALRLALAQIQTADGAVRIYVAEKVGKNRPQVMRCAERRIVELHGEALPQRERLIFGAEAVETARLVYEGRH